MAGLKQDRPAASANLNGSLYYATDQDALYLCISATWQRIGVQAGDIIWTAENTARAGCVIASGQAWPSTTGLYADLFAKWGGLYPSVLPDLQARTFVAKGTHADVSTIGFTEGLGVSTRRPRHKHPFSGTTATTNNENASHTHRGILTDYVGGAGGIGGIPTSTGASIGVTDTGTESAAHGHTYVATGTVGPQTGAEPQDSAAYIVLQPQVKL
jgi:hypothetical protein